MNCRTDHHLGKAGNLDAIADDLVAEAESHAAAGNFQDARMLQMKADKYRKKAGYHRNKALAIIGDIS